MSRRMKDSGIEWIGEIPEDWDTVRTKVAFKVISGATPKSGVEKYWDGDIAWVTPSDFKTDDIYILNINRMISEDGLNSCGTEVVPVNSIIISNRAPIGSVALNGIPLCTNQGCKSLTSIANENYNKFFYYYFSIMDSSLNMLGRGTTFLELSTFDLKNFMIPYPNYNNQQKIANFLDKKVAEIDHILDKTRESIEEYKKYKQSIITEAVTKGLNPDVKMKDSGIEWIGEIPEHWEVTRLKNLLDSPLKYGANSSGITYDENLPRYIRITDVTLDNNLKGDGKLSLPIEEAEEFLLTDNDILFARSGATVGKTFLYKEDYGLSAFAGYLIKASVSDINEPEFIYYYTLSSAYNEWKNRIFIQATIQNIGANKYSNMEIVIPSNKDEQIEIVKFIQEKTSHIDNLISQKEQLLSDLEAYKKSLIYECVTGKREVV